MDTITYADVMDDADGDDAPCDACRAQRALVHCGEHAARLCLPCDVAAHARAPAHERAPLCDACHAAPAAARCDDAHGTALCAACGPAAQRHGGGSRPAIATYTGFPEPAELARILAVDVPPAPETTWIPTPYDNGINTITQMFEGTNPESLNLGNGIGMQMNHNTMSGEMFEGANPENGNKMGEMTGAAEAALLIEDADEQDTSCITWPNLNDAAITALDAANLSNSIRSSSAGNMESAGSFQEFSSLNYDQPMNSSWSELVMPSDNTGLLQPLTKNRTPYDELQLMNTNNTSNAKLKMPFANFCADISMPPPDLWAGSSMMDGKDGEPSSSSQVTLPEKSCVDLEKRQQAMQRYHNKKKKRRFDKQIMYASRKATADTRKRVKGRFVKA